VAVAAALEQQDKLAYLHNAALAVLVVLAVSAAPRLLTLGAVVVAVNLLQHLVRVDQVVVQRGLTPALKTLEQLIQVVAVVVAGIAEAL
jgi:hypothetical protein